MSVVGLVMEGRGFGTELVHAPGLTPGETTAEGVILRWLTATLSSAKEFLIVIAEVVFFLFL